MPPSEQVDFYLFDPQNHIYTSRRASKIGMHMDWHAFSLQLKNHENRKIFKYDEVQGRELFWGSSYFSSSFQGYFIFFKSGND